MKLNLPQEISLAGHFAKGVLIAGIGGGYDVFGGLPILYQLKNDWSGPSNNTPGYVLANYSAKSNITSRLAQNGDNPEWPLSETGVKTYCIGREGVQSVRKGYEKIIEENNIDTIILVDGGVDSLMRGNEPDCGTVLEDSISITAVSQIQGPKKFLACIGFGTEVEEGVGERTALINMANLMREDAFIGSCSLVKSMEAFSYYERITKTVMDRCDRKSHIHSRVIPAVHGEDRPLYESVDARIAGAINGEVFINPLMSIYWFFNLDDIVRRNLLVSKLKNTNTFTDARVCYRQFISETK